MGLVAIQQRGARLVIFWSRPAGAERASSAIHVI